MSPTTKANRRARTTAIEEAVRRAIPAGIVTWIAAVVIIAASGEFVVRQDSPPWPTIVAVLIPPTIFVALLRSITFRKVVLGLDPRLVIAAQLWRVVGVAFLFGWATGDLEAGFAIPAGIGDVATGIAALALLATALAGGLTRRHVVAFTLLGVGDFAVALATGALLRPAGLDELPWILFPTLAVPFFLIIHIIQWLQFAEDESLPRTPLERVRPEPSGNGLAGSRLDV